MKFKIRKELSYGSYLVKITLEEFTGADVEKGKRFGIPLIKIRHSSGAAVQVRISELAQYAPYEFRIQDEAEAYVTSLKDQIQQIQQKWNISEDKWTSEEEL